VSDLPGCGKDRALDDAREAECAVCHKPLGRPNRPEKHQFCDSHDEEDLRIKVRTFGSSEERPERAGRSEAEHVEEAMRERHVDEWERFYERQ
jgi:hypothetical protein